MSKIDCQMALALSRWFGLNLQDCIIHGDLSRFNDLLIWSQLGIGGLVMFVILGLLINRVFYRTKMEWHSLEVIWTLAPGLVLVGLGAPRLSLLYELESGFVLPDLTVKIVGSQWFWSYELTEYGVGFDAYADYDSLFGQREASARLVLPINSIILLLVTSTDVIHRWALPGFGVKADCNPGRLNRIWMIRGTPVLVFRNCFELCGAFHSRMPIAVEFVTSALFSAWCFSL